MRSTLQLFTAVGTAALLAACGGSDSKAPTGIDTGNGSGNGNSTLGSFTGSSTGDIALGLGGSAVFGTESEGLASEGFELGLGAFTASGETGTNGAVVFYRGQDGLPAAGTYQLFDATSDETAEAAQFAAAISLRPQSGTMGYLCSGTGGTLTLSSVSATKVRGSFSVQAVCARPTVDEAVQVSVSGQFEATKGIQTIPTP